MAGWKIWRGRELMDLMNKGARMAVYQTGDAIVMAGKSEVPLDEGILRNTGTVVMDQGGKPSGCACFGGGPSTGWPVIPYAIRWHEETANFQHGRKRHYLRDPFNKLAKSKFQQNLIINIRSVLQ